MLSPEELLEEAMKSPTFSKIFNEARKSDDNLDLIDDTDEFDEDIFDERIVAVEGDITDFKYFEDIISVNIDTVINCAANVKHFSSGTDIEDINLGGVVNGLKYAKMKNAKYVQVSTYSVAGESINNFPPLDVAYSEKDLFIGQGIDNQYLSVGILLRKHISILNS